ncbi:metalloregulator ArsR/SmtB family transcription factor [Nakamurella sp. UYEF19]|uniref:ArsR/SmtB family transcription factor n=1 Tax=Nakamurella sp. UYEF19 TaxID=1756392 RepID=UPI00339B227C
MDADKQIRRESLPGDQVALAVEVFRMLADGTRIQILWELMDREMSVNELADTVGKPGPSVSQHLAKLRMARLVRTRRDGNQMFYQLENDHIRQLIIDAINNAEHAGPTVPRHHLVQSDPLSLPAIHIHDAATESSAS